MVPEGTSRWALEVRRRRLRARRLAVGAGLVALLLGLYLFMRSPYFALDHLRIRGYERLDPATVRDLAGIPAGTLIWRVDPDAVARRLEAHPRVAGAVVRREWPRGLVIELQERATVAVLVERDGPRWAELDAQGRILASGRGDPPRPTASAPGQGRPGVAAWADDGGEAGRGGTAAPVPLVEWEAPPERDAPSADLRILWEPGRFVPEPLARAAAVAAALEAAPLPEAVVRLVAGPGGVLEVHLASGIHVRWGRSDVAPSAKVRALAAVLAAVDRDRGARPAYIDVTDPERPVLGPPARDDGRG
ncbi:MAG TPA: FtsQ-type POTRA domain-containing protein [Thermaerobacter sp.]